MIFAGMTLFFAPYIVHHRVLMRLANYLPKVIDQFSTVMNQLLCSLETKSIYVVKGTSIYDLN